MNYGLMEGKYLFHLYVHIFFILEKWNRWEGHNNCNLAILEHVYMRPEVNPSRFEVSNRFESCSVYMGISLPQRANDGF